MAKKSKKTKQKAKVEKPKISAHITEREMKAWVIAVILSVVVFILFVEPYLSMIILGTLMAYLFYPVHTWFMDKLHVGQGFAATLTSITSFLFVGVPLTIVIAVAFTQGLQLVTEFADNNINISGENLTEQALSVTDEVNKLIENVVGAKDVISTDGVVNFMKNTLPTVLNTVVKSLTGIVSGIPNFFMLLIIYLFIFISLLTNKDKVLGYVKSLSPFDEKVNELYLSRIGAMAKAMVKGQFVIAFIQGLLGAISMSVIGLGDYILFFTLIFTVMNFIPLGSGLLIIPIGLITLLFGDYWQGAVILLNHFFVVTNVDNILRPMLVPEQARLPAALTLLSAFAGVVYFGFLGVVYGPIIMIFLMTTFEMFKLVREKYREQQAS